MLGIFPVSIAFVACSVFSNLRPWIHQALGSQRVFNVPDSAFSNGAGSFSTQLQLAQEQQFLVTMSDATGFATGGISPVLSVEAATGGAACNTTDPGPAFVFSDDDALQQCL